jgi:hypothetical protein
MYRRSMGAEDKIKINKIKINKKKELEKER